ncbi:hypothetical protein [Streptomyces albireticuli]|uniref:hypothetical protein n=1 Tax=Streptomyces albireticuli TaxID=1940 RepID=UPI0036C3EA98
MPPEAPDAEAFNVAQSAEARQDVKAVQTASGYAVGVETGVFPSNELRRKTGGSSEIFPVVKPTASLSPQF